jgi:hypothetical protein
MHHHHHHPLHHHQQRASLLRLTPLQLMSWMILPMQRQHLPSTSHPTSIILLISAPTMPAQTLLTAPPQISISTQQPLVVTIPQALTPPPTTATTIRPTTLLTLLLPLSHSHPLEQLLLVGQRW